MFVQILSAFKNNLVYFLYLYKTIIELLKFKINLKVGYLLVVYYEECNFKIEGLVQEGCNWVFGIFSGEA